MMVFEYLKKQMTNLVCAFKNAKVNYEYDDLAKIHTIEVLPLSVFDSDEFAKWECQFFIEAYKLFPGEDIGFISEDAYVGIQHLDWSIQGDEYLQSDDILDDHITIDVTCEPNENISQKNVNFKYSGYSTFKESSSELFEFEKTENLYNEIYVLKDNATFMAIDDSLLQAA